jgi:general secretion pathway protein E
MTQNALATILRTSNRVAEADLAEAQRLASEGQGSLDEILLKKKYLTETELLTARGTQYGLPVLFDLPLECTKIDHLDQVPIGFLKKHLLLPLGKECKIAIDHGHNTINGTQQPFFIAIYNPVQIYAADDLARLLEIDAYKLVLAPRAAILSAINLHYDPSPEMAEQIVQDMTEDGRTIINEIEDTADLLDDTSDAPIIKLVNHIISQSVNARASDIHIEPFQDAFKVRYRVDGILYDMLSPPKWIQSALISRIKVMGKMNIAEKRLPQDSRIDVKVGNHEIDIRVSTIPTVFGERVVMRLLNKSGDLLRLTELGLSANAMASMQRIVGTPNGIFLMTGPTGSGKTTTLYALLSTINRPDINIITIEDPVEYQINGVNQIQVNPKIDLTFARGLRSIVRQDPDVILVGEIRDKETAEIAVQSALTGHLVFSTLHTNDAPSAITRLVNIGVEPFLISSSVIAVAAQRLVRVLCRHCKKAYDPSPAMLATLGVETDQIEGRPFYQATGCGRCFNTGYLGRVGIFEIMEINQHLEGVILTTFDAKQIRSAALKNGMLTLRADGVQKVLEGTTTVEEVLRVT